MGPNIDATLFDTPEFVEGLKTLALSSPRAEIKIIAQATKINVQRGHRVIPLAQHLTSSIHLHKPDTQRAKIQNILLLIDDFAYFKCPRATIYEGTACFYDRLEVQGLQAQFNDIWEHSTADLSIRRLHL